ncbi:MAG: DMT family transporter [Sphingomonadaceae bacterium]|uniref:DMT family transporter n=1 Tax=Thermaurantiacus sp. TaxID=2820283 RepID=UPI00298F1C77|nr:DMT family transporter [Thermaurantiacus sp.]MCS6987401.1 DMT family transporter [Sphingomonadaceae bacterium]MDW8415321.1 DMT family transporter [Thermaurantiacus sp.]
MTTRQRRSFLGVVLLWGTTWIVIKDQLGTVDPSWSVAYRFAAGGLALLGWCRLKGEPLGVPRGALGFLSLFGLLQFVLNFNFLYRAEAFVPSGLPAVAFALLMVPNALFAFLFLGRRPSARFAAGSGLGVAGVALLFAEELRRATDPAGTLEGIALLAAAILSASAANVLHASPAAARIPPLGGLAWAMLLAAAMNATLAAAVAGPPAWDPRPQYAVGVLFLGVLASAIAFALYFDLVRTLGPAEAAWTGVPIPVLAMAISTVVEGYRWTGPSVAGAALALAGLVVALRAPASART